MNKKMLLIGGGGHCKSVLDTLLEINEFSEIGIIDIKENLGNTVLGISVIGTDDDLQDLFDKGYKYAFVSLGSVGNPSRRIKLFNLIKRIGYEIPTIIDLSAKISYDVKIGEGVFVGKQAVINAGNIIEKGSIINTGSIIEHDCQIGAFVHIASGVTLGGEVVVGDESHVGLGTSVKQQVTIGAHSIIGMGSVVLKNIRDDSLAYGNPCLEVKEL